MKSITTNKFFFILCSNSLLLTFQESSADIMKYGCFNFLHNCIPKKGMIHIVCRFWRKNTALLNVPLKNFTIDPINWFVVSWFPTNKLMLWNLLKSVINTITDITQIKTNNVYSGLYFQFPISQSRQFGKKAWVMTLVIYFN